MFGQLLSVHDSGGSRTTNWYNNQGLIVAVSNAFGRVSAAIYDKEDRATNTVDANGITNITTFDDLGRILSRTYPDTGVETFQYSARGLIGYTNQLGKVTKYTYDEAGRKIGETNANNNEVVQFKYDPSGNLTNLIDGKSQTNFWKYDQFGRVTNKVDATSADMFRYGYDANGGLTNRWTPAKGTTKYAYDSVGNLTSVDYSNSTDITLQYDALNRLTNMVDAVGTTRFTYAAFGALLSEDGPWENDTVTYGYDNGRRRSSLTLLQPNASAWTQSYGYDAANRLTNITSLAGAFGYSYKTVGMLIEKLTLPPLAYITNAFDNMGQVLATHLRNSGNTLLNKHEYVYNVGQQRTKQTRFNGDYVDYTYDDIGQLLTANGKEPGGVTNRWQEQFTYSYDAAENLTNRIQNKLTNAFTVNALNQLTGGSRGGRFTVAGTTTSAATNVTVNTSNSVLYLDYTFASTNHALSDGTNAFTAVGKDNLGRVDTNTSAAYLPSSPTFAYDSNGNLTYDGQKSFEYDDENQLTRLTATNAWKSEFSYDGKLRRRIRREYTWQNSAWVVTNDLRYVYDGNLVIQERNSWNVPSVTYTRGSDLSGDLEGAGGIGGLLARTDSTILSLNPSSAHACYFADANGNVTALIDTNQQVAAQYLYSPFGNVLSASGPVMEGNVYRFSSREAHAPSDLMCYLYRYYDSAAQRWLNRDPAGDIGFQVIGMTIIRARERSALLPYTFSHNSPVDNFDAYGLAEAGGGKGPPKIPQRPDEVDDLLKKITEAVKDALLDRLGDKTFKDAKKACDDLRCGKPGTDDPNWYLACQLCAVWKCAKKHYKNTNPTFVKKCLDESFSDCLAHKAPK